MGRQASSKRTRQCRAWRNIFGTLHIACLFGPIAYHVVHAYITGTVQSKISMSLTIIIAIILAGISALVSITARAGLQRCVLWILMIGVVCCLNEIKTFIWIMSITSILDELVFVKLRDRYNAALISNKELDRRV